MEKKKPYSKKNMGFPLIRMKYHIWVVASLEAPIPVVSGQPLPSAIFVPASAGLLLASTCVQRLIES